MKRHLHLIAAASIAALLAGPGAFAQVAASDADALQIIAERAAAARTAGIMDVDAHRPVEAIAGCDDRSRRFVRKPKAAPAPLASALLAAQFYSDSQKGKGLLVMVDGVVIHENYAASITPDTHFVSQSLHKSLLALAVLAAVEDGILGSLDDPLGKYIPAWAGDPRGAITLRQAMQMASGIELFTMAGGDQRALALAFGTDLEAAALASPLETKPGSQFAYNNANAQLAGTALANALAAASKGRYASYLSSRIWCPLGNGDAAVRLDRAGGSPQYFAGVHASLRDWARVGEAVRTAKFGRKAAPPLLNQMLTPSPLNPNFGLFAWLGAPADGKRRYSAANPLFIAHSAPFRAGDMVFMDGFGGQRVYVSRDARLVIARFGDVSFAYDDAILPNLIVEGLLASGRIRLP